MVETNNKETTKNTEKCFCEKKISTFLKEIKVLKEEVEKQSKQIETLKKVLKTK